MLPVNNCFKHMRVCQQNIMESMFHRKDMLKSILHTTGLLNTLNAMGDTIWATFT